MDTIGESDALDIKVHSDRQHRSGERRAMEVRLFRQILLVTALSAAIMAVRELFMKSASGPIIAATVLSTALALFPKIWRNRLIVVAPLFFSALVLLITQSAKDLGGAEGPALSMAFVPGFLATLVLGPMWGWVVTAEMLGSLAWLGLTTPLRTAVSELRFVNEVSMTLFATGLGHGLVRSFAIYERLIERRQAVLEELEARRLELARAIYEQLEPAARQLPDSIEDAPFDKTKQSRFDEAFDRLSVALQHAKRLAHREPRESSFLESADPSIRRDTMRTWLRLAVLLMLFFTVRNALFGETVIAPLFLVGICIGFDVWLSRATRDRHLELAALVMGTATASTLFFHIPVYGRTPNIPVLVMAPAAVLFTAILSRGPATWLVVAFNCGILAWAATGHTLNVSEIRLVGDLAISFLVVAIALGSVFSLRSAFAKTLLEQAGKNAEALRQHRRLAGTLFHDASNHLQAILLYLTDGASDADLASGRALSRRVERLVVLSKQFLTDAGASPVAFAELRLTRAFALLREAFQPQLKAKELAFELGEGGNLAVRCEPDLLVESVLGNLVSNAVKFSPEGGTIQVSAHRTGDEVRVVVEDNGPGVPPKIVEARSEDGALPTRRGTRGEAGQGYGLRLAQEHAARMGGRVEIGNRPNGGARCVVWLRAGHSTD